MMRNAGFCSNTARLNSSRRCAISEKYIKPGDRVLEIGAGTGRYSHALAHRGYRVDAVELVDHNIEIFRSHITPDENVSITGAMP